LPFYEWLQLVVNDCSTWCCHGVVGGCRQGRKAREIEGLTTSSCSWPPLAALSPQNGGWPCKGGGGLSGWGHRGWLAAHPDQLGPAVASKDVVVGPALVGSG
jgi:hypothetical protein